MSSADPVAYQSESVFFFFCLGAVLSSALLFRAGQRS